MSPLLDTAKPRDAAELPFVDAHTIEVSASAERVWDVLVTEILPGWGAGAGPLGRVGTRALACPYTDPPPPGAGVPSAIVGFRVERAERPTLVALAGRHRFASYTLTLRVESVAGRLASRLSAETCAAFPGPAGRVYRAAVIDSGAHVLVVRRLLSQVKRSAQRG
jgi:hypothetical protein